MGYTHYYDVSAEFDSIAFGKVAVDFKKIIPPLKHLGITLADDAGENHPTISPTEITFNGLEKCGHEERELGITWPGKSASGVSTNKVGQQLQELVNGKWFAGAQLSTRVCGGDCSHETFSLEQKLETTMTRYDRSTYQDEPKESAGQYFQCVKTAFKPYDLAVTVCLVIAKQHLGENIVIRSDGSMENWHEAMNLCHHFLGYGRGFILDDEKSVPLDNTNSSAMVSQCDKNTKEITSLKETQEKFEDEKREQVTKINDRYRKTIYDLERQQRIETEKLEDKMESVEKETHQKIEKLSEAKHTLDRVLYFLKIQNTKLDSTPLDKIKSYRDRHLEIAEKWNDENMELHLFIAENDRPKNKYSVIIVGNSKIGSSDRNDTILVLPHSYGVNIDAWNLDILTDVNHFPSISDAKKYLKTHNIQSILKEFFVQYGIVKSEYDSVISKYTLSDFEDILRVRLSKYFEGGTYSESKMIQAAKKLGVNTITVSEMSFEQVSLLAERYL